MFVTVTPNAALDKTLDVANFQLGQRHRCQQGRVQAGGKGINVARALKQLAEPVVATGLAGGANGTRIVEELAREGVLNDFVRIADESRVSTVVIDPTVGRQTEINEYGPEIDPGELAVLEEKIRYLSRGAHAVVLAGSLPRRVPQEWYAQTVRELRRRKVPVVLDTEGDPLRLGVAAEPDLVSPNQYEAEELVGHEFQGDADFIGALDEIADMGVRNIIITRESGCFALLREGSQTLRFQVEVDLVEPVSSVGSGDALLAGYLASRARGKAPEEALRQGVGCGTANALSLPAAVFDPREAARFASKARVLEVAPAGTA
jgi:1-phosphofructokinase family hexose kinase